jgi:hypothetical protein
MKKLIAPSMIVLVLTLAGCSNPNIAGNSSSTGMADSRQDIEQSPEAIELKESMRKLWSDHVIWTREYVVAAVAGTPDAQPVADRLLKNQDDIGNAIVPYYGQEAGDRLSDLLRQHILIAVDLVAAAKAGDNTKLADADKRWHDNATDIAKFLSSANPNWPEQEVAEMLNQHLKVTTDEATARLGKDWDADIAAFDSIFTQILEMADDLTAGIIKQFPEKFQ